MTKRLGFKTDHVMLNLERKMNEAMNDDPKINKSALVNSLLRKHFEGKLCPHCYTPNITHYKCNKCDQPYIVCEDETPDGGVEKVYRNCQCSAREMFGALVE
jgi:hypothetical protein